MTRHHNCPNCECPDEYGMHKEFTCGTHHCDAARVPGSNSVKVTLYRLSPDGRLWEEMESEKFVESNKAGWMNSFKAYQRRIEVLMFSK